MADKETVVVGCRVPNGLRLHVMRRREQPVAALLDAGMPGMAHFDDLGFLELAGTSTGTGRPKTEAYTTVDKAMFDAWMAENAENALVTSGAVYVSAPEADAATKPEPEQDSKPAARPEPEDGDRPGDDRSTKSGFARVAPDLPAQE